MSQSTEQFWASVQACFDQRRDPLDDEGVQAYLCEHEDLCEDFVALRGRVYALSGVPAKPTRWLKVAGIAAAVLTVCALNYQWFDVSQEELGHASGARILSYDIRLERRFPRSQRVIHVERVRNLRRMTQIDRWQFIHTGPLRRRPMVHSFGATLTTQ